MNTPRHRPQAGLLKHLLMRAAAATALGLGLPGAAWAQMVEGEVREVNTETGKLTLKHEAIKNIDLPAMPKMIFRVADPAWLKTLQVGDQVRFSADKVDGKYTVTAIQKK